MLNKQYFQVVLIVFYRSGRFLLTRRKDKKKAFANRWHIPGGSWEINEDIDTAIRREVKEELGIKLKEYKVLPYIFEEIRGDRFYLYVVFYAPFPEKAKIVLNEEADLYGWFTLDEIKKLPSFPLTYQQIKKVNEIIEK